MMAERIRRCDQEDRIRAIREPHAITHENRRGAAATLDGPIVGGP